VDGPARRTHRADGAEDREEPLLRDPVDRRIHAQRRLHRQPRDGQRRGQLSHRGAGLVGRQAGRDQAGLPDGNPIRLRGLSHAIVRRGRHGQRQAHPGRLQGAAAVGVPQATRARGGAEGDWFKPVSAQEQRASLEFFNELAFAIRFIPTHPAAQRFRDKLADVGFVPGARFDFDKADPLVREAMRAGMQEGQAAIDEERKKRDSSMGLFGTREDMHYDPLARALGAQVGIYANSPEEAMYSTYESDDHGQPLDGAHRYVLRFPKGGLPPVKGFWSLTMYGLPISCWSTIRSTAT
jgi:hypothetical protein